MKDLMAEAKAKGSLAVGIAKEKSGRITVGNALSFDAAFMRRQKNSLAFLP